MAVTLGSTGITFPDATTQTTAATAGAKGCNVQTFNSSGTWTKPSGYNANSRVFIQVWGGGGGGSDAIGGNNGGGGGGGAYNERWIALSSLGATETATVGAGGTRGTTAPGGGAGGNTSFGTLVYAYGGGGGTGSNCNANQFGGGGGGQISAGSRGQDTLQGISSGLPWLQVMVRTAANETVNFSISEAIANVQGNTSRAGRIYDAFWHGGGGGSRVNGTTAGRGSNSVFGGGGGGSVDQAGGTSQLAGSGGTSPGGAATAPAGGGAGGTPASTAASAGAAGRIIVTVFDGT